MAASSGSIMLRNAKNSATYGEYDQSSNGDGNPWCLRYTRYGYIVDGMQLTGEYHSLSKGWISDGCGMFHSLSVNVSILAFVEYANS